MFNPQRKFDEFTTRLAAWSLTSWYAMTASWLIMGVAGALISWGCAEIATNSSFGFTHLSTFTVAVFVFCGPAAYVAVSEIAAMVRSTRKGGRSDDEG